MRNSDKLLHKALRLLQNKKYSAVIRLLESRVPRYLESPEFMLYLGAACFHIGDIGGALSYLGRGERIDPEHIEIRLYSAATHLKKGQTTEAVRIWLSILDNEENRNEAKRGLAVIRSFRNPEEQRLYCQSRQILRLVPGFGIPPSSFIFLILLSIFAGILTAFILLFVDHFSTFRKEEQSRASILGVSKRMERHQPLLETTGNAVYILSEKEVADSYRLALSSFNKGDDNAARREINRLKFSNAASEIKGRVHLLEGHLIAPGFDNFITNYSYAEVITDPILYGGCHVLWKGRVSNLLVDDQNVTFDLLVGYETGKILEGMITVRFEQYVTVNPLLPVEIIGQVEVKQGKLELKGVAIHTIIVD